jgi:hypothetical protein
VNSKMLLGSAVAFFVLSLAQFGHAAVLAAVQKPKPAPDCVGAPPFCITNQSCSVRGGSCATGGIHGEDGYNDINGDGCGCQL